MRHPQPRCSRCLDFNQRMSPGRTLSAWPTVSAAIWPTVITHDVLLRQVNVCRRACAHCASEALRVSLYIVCRCGHDCTYCLWSMYSPDGDYWSWAITEPYVLCAGLLDLEVHAFTSYEGALDCNAVTPINYLSLYTHFFFFGGGMFIFFHSRGRNCISIIVVMITNLVLPQGCGKVKRDNEKRSIFVCTILFYSDTLIEGRSGSLCLPEFLKLLLYSYNYVAIYMFNYSRFHLWKFQVPCDTSHGFSFSKLQLHKSLVNAVLVSAILASVCRLMHFSFSE